MSQVRSVTQGSEPIAPAVIVPTDGRPDGRSAARCRILLVEDDDLIRRVVLRFLRASIYDVTVAGSVEEARQQFDASGGRFDLLLSDVMLPDGNGYELANECHARNPALAILLSSGLPDERLGGDPVDDRHLHFLPKPYGSAELAEALRRALAETRSASLGSGR